MLPAPLKALLSVLLLLVLAGCASTAKIGDAGNTNPKGKTPPPVVLQVFTGIPPDKAKSFTAALAASGGQHDIGILQGQALAGSYSLGGTFRSASGAISYSFEFRDADGVLVDTITGSAPSSGADWSGVTPDTLQQIASDTTQRMAATLGRMGFATRQASLIMPPANVFMAAQPGTHYEVDLETLNGPNAIEAAGIPSEIAAAEPPVPEPEVPPPPKASDIIPGHAVIKVVAVVPVEGSPGKGNGELTEAMRRTLKAAGWPVVEEPRADALVVRGKVDLAKAQGGNQKVAVHWVVETPQGKSLGDVKQDNSVPAGSLDQGWGPAATAVADAASSGIFDIIKAYR
ncbi:hypothetical protein [Aestuariivirga sp.]|uniref:hypothetical protein n=1 Tax=Aestuariivirga sp. TaxID=2650926 RepID=UPI0039E63973